jgi:DNA-binding CsgD family transcriptional regulator
MVARVLLRAAQLYSPSGVFLPGRYRSTDRGVGRSSGPGGRELRAMLALVDDGLHDEPGPPMPWAVMEGMGRLIGHDEVTFCELDFRGPSNPVQQAVTGRTRFLALDRRGAEVATYFRFQHGFLPCEQATVLPGPVSWSDFYSRRQLHATALYCEYFRPFEHCLFVSFPTVPGQTRRFLLWRTAGHGFSERDRTVMALLRPHLYEVFLDAERRKAGVPSLTPREWEVLGLAGTGLSNADIARELYLSPATVRKHMEHVFDAVGVRNRRAAAALALPHRPFPHGRP